jgi:hypothetical protein
MRGLVFFISFCFFLLGYGQSFSFSMKDMRSAEVSTCGLQENTLQYFRNKEHKVTVITDYTDIELEEDYHANDESGATDQKIFLVKSSLLDNWYLTFSYPLLSSSCNTNYNTSFCLPTSPIYIKNRVLRI